MGFKRILLIAIASVIPFAVSAQNIKTNDICSIIPGHWDGIYTVKNTDLCKQLNGCTHLFSVDISHLAGNEYHAELTAAVGNGGEFTLKCDNGVITSPVNPHNKVSVTCTKNNHCFVVYDDPDLSAEARKH